MTSRAKAAGAFAALATAGVAAVTVTSFGDRQRPRAIGDPAVAFGQTAPLLTRTSLPPVCQVAPGKFWGGKWHYGPAILHPTRLERYCVIHQARGGTAVLVSAVPVTP